MARNYGISITPDFAIFETCSELKCLILQGFAAIGLSTNLKFAMCLERMRNYWDYWVFKLNTVGLLYFAAIDFSSLMDLKPDLKNSIQSYLGLKRGLFAGKKHKQLIVSCTKDGIQLGLATEAKPCMTVSRSSIKALYYHSSDAADTVCICTRAVAIACDIEDGTAPDLCETLAKAYDLQKDMISKKIFDKEVRPEDAYIIHEYKNIVGYWH